MKPSKVIILSLLGLITGLFIATFTISSEFNHSYTGQYYSMNDIEKDNIIDLSFDGNVKKGIYGFSSFEGTMLFMGKEYEVMMSKLPYKDITLYIVDENSDDYLIILGKVLFEDAYEDITIVFYQDDDDGIKSISWTDEKIFHMKLDLSLEDTRAYIDSIKYK